MNARDLMDQLVAERRRRGWTQQHVASRCGVNRTAVCRWETEETRTPRLTTVVAYAHALGMRLTLVPHDAHVIIKCLHTWTTGTGPGDPNDTGVHTCQREGHHVEHRCTCGASIITATA